MKASEIRQANGTTQARRTNTALRLARIALREDRTPSVRLARDAIAWCARMAEDYRDGGAALEAAQLARYACGHKQTDER